jgi:CBS domain containing-hemolysin-like protein
VALSIVVFLHMVVGEMAPKNLALARPEQTSIRLARPFGWFVRVLRPLIVGLNVAANGLVRLTGTRPVDEHNLVHTPEELAMALRESHRHGMLGSQDLRVMAAALRLADIDAEAAMTPRTDLATIPDDAPASAVLDAASRSGFTRFLVVHENLDDVVGLVNVKDALTRDLEDLAGMTVTDLMRPVLAVPENRELPELLAEMRADRSHAVLVVDEYGGTAGLVTLEDVIEELVGDIQDEFDPSAVLRRRMGRSGWVVDGTMRRDELERLTGLRLPEGETETLNGFMVEHFGRLLRRGDTVVHEGWQFRVLATGGRRARRIQVQPPDGTQVAPPGS